MSWSKPRGELNLALPVPSPAAPSFQGDIDGEAAGISIRDASIVVADAGGEEGERINDGAATRRADFAYRRTDYGYGPND
jgi:hypothetical protein